MRIISRRGRAPAGFCEYNNEKIPMLAEATGSMKDHELLVSNDESYIAARNNEELRLYWGEKLVWSKDLENLYCEFLYLGNNGDLLVRQGSQLVLYRLNNAIEAIPRFSPPVLTRARTSLGRVVSDHKGNSLCVELVQEVKERDEGLKKSLLRSLIRKNPLMNYQIILYDMNLNEEKEIWSFQAEVDEEKPEKPFFWDISRNMNLLAIAERSEMEQAVKGSITRLYLLNLQEDRSLYQINLTNLMLKDLHINNQGVILLDFEEESLHQMMVVSQKAEKTFIRQHSLNFELVHLGNHGVVIRVKPDRVLLFKDFSDNLVYLLDEKVLESFGIEYPVAFRGNDDMLAINLHEKNTLVKRHTYTWRANMMDFLYHK
jgi:hypothetical protein